MWHCNCLRCSAVRGNWRHMDVDANGNGQHPKFKPGPCQLCPMIERRKDHWKQVTTKRFVPEEITNFLGMTHICSHCIGMINHHLQAKLHVCWGKAHPDVVKLAICMMLRSALVGLAYHEIWEKNVITDSLKKGRTMPPWAPPAAHKQWKALHG